MFRQFAFLAVFLLGSAHTFKFEDIPVEFREFMPSDVRTFIVGLSDADKAVLKEIVKSGSIQTEDQMEAAITAKSPELGAKFKKVHDVYKKKLAALGPEAQAFAKQSLKKYMEIRAKYYADNYPSKTELKEAAMTIIKGFQALSDDAKADFKKQLPECGTRLSNDMVIKRIEALN